MDCTFFYTSMQMISLPNNSAKVVIMSNCPKCGSKNTEWTDCKTVNNKTIVVCVCSDCKHTWEQAL